MKQYHIQITGEGSQEDIVKALKSLIISIEHDLESSLNFGKIEWEDYTLFTEIKEL